MKKYKLTADDFCNAQSLNTSWKALGLIAFIIVAILNLVAGEEFRDPEGRGQLLIVLGVVGGIMMLFGPNSMKRQRKMMFYKHRVLREEVTLSMDEDEIAWVSKSGSFRSKWERIHSSKIGKGVILIYETATTMRIVPSEYLHPLFATPQQAVDFVDRGRTATRHHGKQKLRASGLDESQELATKQASRNELGCDSNIW